MKKVRIVERTSIYGSVTYVIQRRLICLRGRGGMTRRPMIPSYH